MAKYLVAPWLCVSVLVCVYTSVSRHSVIVALPLHNSCKNNFLTAPRQIF